MQPLPGTPAEPISPKLATPVPPFAPSTPSPPVIVPVFVSVVIFPKFEIADAAGEVLPAPFPPVILPALNSKLIV